MRAELQFLKQQFAIARQNINQEAFYDDILVRKFCHSYRVWQNGCRIMKCDLAQLNPLMQKLCNQALLFHDIGRFRETVLIREQKNLALWGQKFDHGELGADILATSNIYNDIKLVLAVKYHGRMIDDFYADRQYRLLPPAEQKSASTIVKLVRDADKLDLYYLQNQGSLERDVFFCALNEDQKYAPVSPMVKEQFINRQTIKHSTIKNMADRIIGCLSWQFDFNYPLTRQIYQQSGAQQNLLSLLTKYCPETEWIKKMDL